MLEYDESGNMRPVYSDCDMTADSDNLKFSSAFTGSYLTFDGHPFFYTAVMGNAPIYVIYNAPVLVNSERKYLEFIYYADDNTYSLTGTLYGMDKNGLPTGYITELKNGDKIRSLSWEKLNDGKIQETLGDEFTIQQDGSGYTLNNIVNQQLSGNQYLYVYVITDIFGNQYYSDMATMEKSGERFVATNVEPYKTDLLA